MAEFQRIWPDSKPGTITFFVDDPGLSRFTADRNADDSAPWQTDELFIEGFLERIETPYEVIARPGEAPSVYFRTQNGLRACLTRGAR